MKIIDERSKHPAYRTRYLRKPGFATPQSSKDIVLLTNVTTAEFGYKALSILSNILTFCLLLDVFELLRWTINMDVLTISMPANVDEITLVTNAIKMEHIFFL